jgi:hypothetical protein
MKISKTIFLFTIVFILFLYLDNKAYYYGFGNGFVSSKIPKRFEIFFGGSDFGNQGMILIENDMKLLIINRNDSIFMHDNPKNKIIVNKFAGYWFDDKNIIAKIKDKNNNNRYIQVYEEITNTPYPKFIIKEIKYLPNKLDNLKYVDLDKSLSYFKKLKLLKNIFFILFIISLFYIFKIIFQTFRNYIFQKKC